jgi:hypothetical protein
MTMVSTGPISLGGTATSGGLNQSVNVELGRSGTATINMNESAVRTLAGVPSGAIAMNNFYGKSNAFAFSFGGGTDVNLRTAAVNAGWNQTSLVIATNTGTIQSSSTGTPALTISGSFPNGVSLINNALIVGRGGNGGTGGVSGAVNGTAGAPAGTAISASVPVSITNNSTVAGGGGGGGGGGLAQNSGGPGGGGGGGIGVSAGGPAPAAGGVTATPGSPGTTTAAGSGGAGRTDPRGSTGGRGGDGGGYGSSGATGGTSGFGRPGSGGGSAGPATVGNSFITWVATGTRLGPLN